MNTQSCKLEYLDLDELDLESDYVIFSRYGSGVPSARYTAERFSTGTISRPEKSFTNSPLSNSLDNTAAKSHKTSPNHASTKFKNKFQRLFRTKSNAIIQDKSKLKPEKLPHSSYISSSPIFKNDKRVEEFVLDEREFDKIVNKSLIQSNNNYNSLYNCANYSNNYISLTYPSMIDVVKDKDICRDIPLISPCVDIKNSGLRITSGTSQLQSKHISDNHKMTRQYKKDSETNVPELPEKGINKTTWNYSRCNKIPHPLHSNGKVLEITPSQINSMAKFNKEKIEAENSQRLDSLIFSKPSSTIESNKKGEKQSPSENILLPFNRMSHNVKGSILKQEKTEINKHSPWNLSLRESKSILDFTEKSEKEEKEAKESDEKGIIEVLDIEINDHIIPESQIKRKSCDIKDNMAITKPLPLLSKTSFKTKNISNPEEVFSSEEMGDETVTDMDDKDNVVLEITKRGNLSALQDKIRDMDAKQFQQLKDRHGNNLAHISTIFGHINCLKFISSKFSKVISEENKSGLTPAACAIKYGNLCCLQWLAVETQAWHQLNPADGKRSLIHYASKYSQSDILNWLLNYMQDSRLDLNPVDIYGNTPAHLAAKYGNLSCLQILSEAGGNMVQENKFGHTPSFCADYNGHVECVKYLLVVETAMTLSQDVTKLEKEKEKEFEENDRLTSYLNQVIGISQRLINQVEGQLTNMCEVLQEINQELVGQLEDAYQENCTLRQRVNGGVKNGFKGEMIQEMRNRCHRLNKLYKEMKEKLITPSKEEAEHIKCIQLHVTQRLTAMRNPEVKHLRKTSHQLFLEIAQNLATKIRSQTLKAKDASLCGSHTLSNSNDIQLPDSESIEESMTSPRASYCSSERQTTGHASEKSFDSLANSDVSSTQKFTDCSIIEEKEEIKPLDDFYPTLDSNIEKNNLNVKENLPDLTLPIIRKNVHTKGTISNSLPPASLMKNQNPSEVPTFSFTKADSENKTDKKLTKTGEIDSCKYSSPFNRNFGTRSLIASNKNMPSNSKSAIQTAPSNYIFLHMYEGRKSFQEKRLEKENYSKDNLNGNTLGVQIPCSDHTPPMTKMEYYIDNSKSILKTNASLEKPYIKPIIMEKSSLDFKPISNSSLAPKKMVDLLPNERFLSSFQSTLSKGNQRDYEKIISSKLQEKLTSSTLDLSKINKDFLPVESTRRSILKTRSLARSESDLSKSGIEKSSEFVSKEGEGLDKKEVLSNGSQEESLYTSDSMNAKFAKHKLQLKRAKSRGRIEMTRGDFHDSYERPFSRADSFKSQSSSFSSYDSEIRSNGGNESQSSTTSGCHEFVRQPVVYRKVYKSVSSDSLKDQHLQRSSTVNSAETITQDVTVKSRTTGFKNLPVKKEDKNEAVRYKDERIRTSVLKLDDPTNITETSNNEKPWYDISDDDADSLPRRHPRPGSFSDEDSYLKS